MSAVISKGITLTHNDTALKNLQDIPELGGSTEAIEITCLEDAARKYTDGIENYGDSIPFTFLYDAEQFASFDASTAADTWKVTLPNGKFCTFTGKGTVKLNGVGVNGVLTYTLSVRPNSKIEWNKTA